MSKYHEIKNKLTVSQEEEQEYKKSSITKMIEQSALSGEKIPEFILNNINFNEGFFTEYYLINSENHQHNIKSKETIAQNIMFNLPLNMYEKYMDITWLKTFEEDSDQLIRSLINKNKFDVIEKFLDLISEEKKTDDFNREVFSPIFHLSHNIMNLSSNFQKETAKEKQVENIKTYLELFQKAIKVWEPFYKQTCQNYKVKPKNVKNWHRNFEYIYMINEKNKLHEINLEILKNDEYLWFIKDIFSQYLDPKENTYLSKEYFEEAVKNSQEKIITYYIAELLKHKDISQEEIEKSITNAFNEKIKDMNSYISESFRESYSNNYKNTYDLDSIYHIAIKYGNYKTDYQQLSKLILIDNVDFYNNFVSKILPEEKITIKNMTINQWKQMGNMIEQIKEITGKGFKESIKQREKRYGKENQSFVDENPYEEIYIINQINKKYIGKANPLTEKELNQVYEYLKKEVMPKMEALSFDIENFKLNNKLSLNLTEKGKIKAKKI